MKSRRYYNRNSNHEYIKDHKSIDHKSDYLAALAKRTANNNELVKMMKISQFYDEIMEDV
jgi:hypothetical protein